MNNRFIVGLAIALFAGLFLLECLSAFIAVALAEIKTWHKVMTFFMMAMGFLGMLKQFISAVLNWMDQKKSKPKQAPIYAPR